MITDAALCSLEHGYSDDSTRELKYGIVYQFAVILLP